MRRHLALISCALICALFAVGSAEAVDIATLHHNTATGVASLLGQTVTVTGVVTAPTDLLDTYHLDIYVQDATGGINVWVYAGASSYNVALGDSVTVTSRIAQYNGMTELGTSSSYTSIINHGPAAATPSVMPITCAQLNATFEPDYSEPNEGRLIRLDNLNITSGTWPTTPGGNSIVYVSDGTGTGKIYIDEDTPVNGSPAPGADFSLIGVLKQYDASSPYTTGYQLIPRVLSDVIGAGGSTLEQAVVRNLTQAGADILFTTTDAGSSEVEYGLTDAYGQLAGDPGAHQTAHTVTLGGLAPNTIYHYRVKSTSATDTAYGPDQLLITASDVPGEIHVLMSHDADHSFAGSFDPVADEEPLATRLSALIYDAESSVDCALYSFSMNNLRGALIAAHNRGCQVRLIIDQNNSTGHADDCAAAGIPYITSGYAGNHPTGSMHNKFVVIDGRDADPYNDLTWTGSVNMSYSGSFDVNNAVWIRDFGVAQAYTLEFNEMWGSDTQTAGPGARMGAAKFDNTPHEFNVAGVRIEQYMSPSDGVTGRIIDAVQTADLSIFFALLAFTHNDISNAMYAQRTAYPGVAVRGLFDQNQSDCSSGSEYYAMSGDTCASNVWMPAADVLLDTAIPVDDYLHHKYLLVDANNPASDPTVLTGSHNWSYSAESINDENTLVLHDAGIANQFLQEFAARYYESGGTGDLIGATSVLDPSNNRPGQVITNARGWPNPFNPQARISFALSRSATVSVAAYDARGYCVRQLVTSQPYASGIHILGWDGKDSLGRDQASGIYFVRISVDNEIRNLKLLLAR